MKDGLELERSGKFEAALDKFRQAKQHFDATYAADPKWNVEIVEYRRKKIGEDVERLEQLASGQLKAFRELAPDRKPDDSAKLQYRLPDERLLKEEKKPKHDKKDSKTKSDVLPGKKNPEVEALRQQLRELEQALQQARQREAALRAVVRDLLNEMEAPIQPGPRSRPMPSPLSEAPWKFAPPRLRSTSPLVPSSPPQPR